MDEGKKDNDDLVELTMLVSREFLDSIERSLDILEKERGYRVDYGEYIEESYYELINAVIELEHRLGAAHKPIDHDNPMHG